ncbi:MAG: hypothetical protein JW888_00750 [Pirellulales bacterium]|nr:hypothetical protein [Pirellulales bacterium]
MGLLDKTNPKATPWSVLRHAAITGAAGAVIYVVGWWLKGAFREHWPVELAIWSGLCALVGAVWEWQVPDKNDPDDVDQDDRPPGGLSLK